MKICNVDTCNNKHYGKGLCRLHYQRQPYILKIKNDWQIKNKERRKEILSKYHKSIKHKNTSKKYKNTTKGRANKIMNWQNYNNRKIKAMPKWADIEKIREVYKNCPKGYHVDHIIPLRGKNVCGLHVHYNLQYLTPKQNMIKGNKV